MHFVWKGVIINETHRLFVLVLMLTLSHLKWHKHFIVSSKLVIGTLGIPNPCVLLIVINIDTKHQCMHKRYFMHCYLSGSNLLNTSFFATGKKTKVNEGSRMSKPIWFWATNDFIATFKAYEKVVINIFYETNENWAQILIFVILMFE